MLNFKFFNFYLFILKREREEGREGERLVLLFHALTRSSVDSLMTPDCRSNPQPMGMMRQLSHWARAKYFLKLNTKL